jgi:carotenoid cleavage dioxygenase
LNPITGLASESAFLDIRQDFPVIDRRLQGSEQRYNFGLQFTPSTADYPAHPIGLVKHDRVSGVTTQWSAGEAVQPDEALFIPASSAAGEDEGWLLTMVYNRATQGSELAIFDATAVNAGPIARVIMPRRVPFGFHGTWVPSAG